MTRRRRAEERLREESRIARTLLEVGNALVAELDTQRLIRMVTDTATRVTGTALGACFYNVVDEAGELQVLSAFSGASDGDQPVRSFLAVPLRARDGHVLGGLFFGHPEPGRFTETDEQIVVGIASQASRACQTASWLC